MLELTLGNGTHAFTLEPQLGEWVLSHPNLRIPARTREFAINASNSRFRELAVKRYVDECLAGRAGRLRLLYEANPISFLIEQAFGAASTGRKRLMDVQPESLHQRIGFVFGSTDEVTRIEGYHRDEPPEAYDSPLFGKRGLYAAGA